MGKELKNAIPMILLVLGVATFILNMHYNWGLFGIVSPQPPPTSITTFPTSSCPSGFAHSLLWSYTTLPFGMSRQLAQQGTIACPSIYNGNSVLGCNVSLYSNCGPGCGMGNPYACQFMSVYDPTGSKVPCPSNPEGWSLKPGVSYTYTIDAAVYANSTAIWDLSNFAVNVCRQMLLSLSLTPDKTVYTAVDDVKITAKITPDVGTFSQPVIMTASIKDISYPYSVIQTTTAQTDTLGNAVITLKGGFATGRIGGAYPATVSFTNPINSSVVTQDININVKGAINTVSGTDSYTQYSNSPITSYVTVTDSQGAAVDPSQIQALRSISTVSSGSIISSDITYLGNGKYKITSTVSTSCAYIPQMAFTYGGFQFNSTTLQITVQTPYLSIDVSRISPIASLNDTGSYTVSVFDSTGAVITPENIYVDVRYPDGSQVKLIPMSQITAVSPGVYKFSFQFTQIEKYTFNIYAEKAGYAKGSAMASVSVNTPTPSGTGIQGLVAYTNWIIIAVLGMGLWFFAKNRRWIG